MEISKILYLVLWGFAALLITLLATGWITKKAILKVDPINNDKEVKIFILKLIAISTLLGAVIFFIELFYRTYLITQV